MLKEIESTGRDGEVDYPELRETLTQLLSPQAAAAKTAAGKLEAALHAAAPPMSLGAILMQQAGVTPRRFCSRLRSRERATAPHGRHSGGTARGATGRCRGCAADPATSRGQAAASDSTIRVDVGLLDS